MYNYNLINSETDAVMFCKADGSPFTEEENAKLLIELNSIFPEHIKWESDGDYTRCLVLKAKNYIMYDGKKKTIKGSAFKTSSKELALKDFMNEVVDSLLNDGTTEDILIIYNKYIKEALNPKEVRRWAQKKSITEAVLQCEGYEELDEEDEDSPRKNETDVWNAVKDIEGLQQGDKVYLYPVRLPDKVTEEPKYKLNKETGIKEVVGVKTSVKTQYGLRIDSLYQNDIATEKLIKRVADTLKIFSTVIDIEQFPKYHLKSNKNLLEALK